MNLQSNSRTISIVIPGFNEEPRMRRSVEALIAFSREFHSKQKRYTLEIIYSLEKSTDETVGLCRKLLLDEAHFFVSAHAVQKGKGHAVKTGVLQATGEFLFFMDLDLSTSLIHIEEFVRYFEKHPEVSVLIGDRKNPQTQILQKQSFVRQKMGEIFNLFVQLFVIRGIRDTQCGFKAFRKEVGHTLFRNLTRNGFSFDVEVLLIAQKLGYAIHSLPVVWKNDRHSKVSIWRDSPKMLWDILTLRSEVNSRTLLLEEKSEKKNAA